MTNTKKVLVPIDLSQTSLNAVTFGFGLAERMKKDLLLFHSKSDASNEENKLSELLRDLRSTAKHIQVDLHQTNRYFNSATINELFNENELEAIVMGTDGTHENFSKQLFGTHAAEVAENVYCPVIVIPAQVKLTKLNKIAFASDLNNLETELPLLFNFVSNFNSEILVFHVSPVFPDLGDIEKRNIHKEIEKISSVYNYPDITYHVEEMQADNKIHAGIEKFINKHRPDALVMFHDHRQGIDRLFSSTETEKIVKDFAIPCIIFPKR